MRVKCVDVYKLSELSEKAQKKAILKHCNINVDHDWWDYTYHDAERVKIKITGFDIGRSEDCTGDFMDRAEESALAIVAEHGPDCETRKTAENYLKERSALLVTAEKDEDTDDISREAEHQLEDLDRAFLRSILGDYLITLRKEYEYLTSEEQIRESIEANEMEFTIDGKGA